MSEWAVALNFWVVGDEDDIQRAAEALAKSTIETMNLERKLNDNEENPEAGFLNVTYSRAVSTVWEDIDD
jgi:hypothetical protein